MQRFLMMLLVIGAVGLLSVTAPVAAQGGGIAVTCPDGTSFDNGVAVTVVQMRSGFDYTATVVGLNGFDPILAVVADDGSMLCTDDDPNASRYEFSLPTTGRVVPSQVSSQVRFSQNSANTFADVSMVVGGFGNMTGDFVLFVEGMGVTDGDDIGDPFSVSLTPNLVSSDTPVSVYMMGRGGLDPLMFVASSDFENILLDNNSNEIYCDDAGNSGLCWGQSSSLVNSYVVTNSGRVSGVDTSAMLTLPTSGMALTGDPVEDSLNLRFTSYQLQTRGQYVLAFHMGTAPVTSVASGGGDKGDDAIGGSAPEPEQDDPKGNTAPPAAASLPPGVSVTCENGTSFDNGVEIIVNQMRSGFNYTATVIGLDGFDPVLAVLGEDGSGFCEDDIPAASTYQADLPTTGFVQGSSLSSQIRFSQNSPSAFADVSLVVGGFGNSAGAFLLFLEGMAVTPEDNAGDPFSMRLTPGMIASGVPVTVYMISREAALDPWMARIDPDYNIITDTNGNDIFCDDAGNSSLCWGNHSSLANSGVRTERGALGGGQFDSMLQLPLQNIQLSDNPDFNFVNFLFSSYQQSTFGQYVLVFHIGTSTQVVPNV